MEVQLDPEIEMPLSLTIALSSIKLIAYITLGTVFLCILAALLWKNKTFQNIIQRLTPLNNLVNLERFRKVEISPKIHAEHCSICYCDIDKEVSSNCGHIFCGDCLIKFWHSKKQEKIACPLCRTDINMLRANFAVNHEDKDTQNIAEGVSRYNISCSDCPTTVLQHVLGSPSSLKIFLGSLPFRRGFYSFIKGFLGSLYLIGLLLYFLCPTELVPDVETLFGWAGESVSLVYLLLYIVVIFIMIA